MLDLHNCLVVLSAFVPCWDLGLALGLTYVSHGLYQNRAEGSIPTLSLSDLPWHCKIPRQALLPLSVSLH